VLHLLLAARKAPSVGLFSTACQTNAFKYAAWSCPVMTPGW